MLTYTRRPSTLSADQKRTYQLVFDEAFFDDDENLLLLCKEMTSKFSSTPDASRSADSHTPYVQHTNLCFAYHLHDSVHVCELLKEERMCTFVGSKVKKEKQVPLSS